jgi:hypothetical protein
VSNAQVVQAATRVKRLRSANAEMIAWTGMNKQDDLADNAEALAAMFCSRSSLWSD